MATTTNFGWQTPDDTDLVKDGAAAMRTLGNSIDTSLMDLRGGTTGQVLAKNTNTDMDFVWVAQDDSNAIQNSIVDAKGDLISATADNTPARLAVGTNGQFLQADSSTSTGLKWGDAGGYTLIAEQTLSSSTGYSFSSIPGTYKHLVLTWTGLTIAAISSEFALRFNADSGSNYNVQYIYFETGSSPSLTNATNTTATPETFGVHTTNAGANTTARGSIIIYDYASITRVKYYNAHHSHYSNNNARNNHYITQGYWSTSGTAITSLDITRVSGSSSISNQTATSVRLYGVN